jgi:2-polyprenyl-3-methyl-5-hydroxy-6-metoxy-1,4-benzoquinol methylase
MTRPGRTLTPTYFDAVYAADSDPWRFASSVYETRKYDATLAALPKSHYVSALEIGCSIGVLTRRLASGCDSLLAVDASQTPLAQAKCRCVDLPSVRFERMFVPQSWPDGIFDLILFSEVIYYLNELDVARLASKCAKTLAPNGDIMLVHWTGETDYPLGGDEAAELFVNFADPIAKVVRQDRYESFRLDVLSRR